VVVVVSAGAVVVVVPAVLLGVGRVVDVVVGDEVVVVSPVPGGPGGVG
jgi:hypothetical protein